MSLDTWPSYSDDDGTGQSGTAVNAALLNLIKAAIEAEVSSASNPTLKAKTIIDEVKAARGSKADLDTRLDVSLNEDGTLKTQASLVSASDYQAALGSKNVATNGNFDRWNNGAAAAPDGWSVSSITIAQCGSGLGDTTAFGTGLYSARLTRAGGVDGYLLQTVIAAADFTGYTNIKSQKFSVACKAKTNTASQIRIKVDDGVTTSVSSYHTGSNTEEHLSVTHQISNSATKLEVRIEMNGSNGDAYCGGVLMTFSNLAPTDWQPFSDQPVQTHKIMNVNTTSVGNVGAGEDDLMSYTLPAGSLSYNGKGVRITAWGNGANNANAKTVRAYYGGTQVGSSFGLVVSALQSWRVIIEIIRTGASAQTVSVQMLSSNSSAVTNFQGAMRSHSITVDTTLAAIIKFTGQATADNDVTQAGMMVELIN